MKVRETFFDFNFTGVIQVLLLVFVASSTNAYAQDEVIRVDTSLVTVPATVIDRDGRYVTNLKKEDFQIFEDGIEQEVAVFDQVEKPFTILLLLDNSGSMNDYLPNLARAANAFVKQLRPDDRLAVAVFSDKKRIQILLEPTKVKDLQLKISLNKRMGDYFTATFDAVENGIEYMKKFQGRRAIVLFTDGEQYGIKASAKSNFRDAEEQESLIYTIRFGVFPTYQPGFSDYLTKKTELNQKTKLKLEEKANFYLQTLAQKTGGRSFEIEDIADLEKTFASVANELGRQYSLGYYPKEQGQASGKRQIKVKMRQPNLVVRARDSYIVESPKTKQK
jgi:VWFA-related protein